MLNQYAVDIPTLPVNQCLSHLIQFVEECQAVLLECRAAEKGRQAFGTHMENRETFLQIQLRPLQHLILKNCINGIRQSKSRFTHQQWKREKKTPVQDQRYQSVPSAKDSVIFSGGDSSKKYGEDKQKLQISDLHFDKIPTPATFACWNIRFKTEVCTCSQFPTEAMHWIKEVELVDSVDDLMSSSSKRGISMLDFEVLDASIASALNRIIHSSHFRRRISLEEQKGPEAGPFPSEDRLLT